jgi:malonyl CoA-acyl carrier protein transacylase
MGTIRTQPDSPATTTPDTSDSIERVIIVEHTTTGRLLKVCESRAAYSQWLSTVDWIDDQTDLHNRKIREEK